MAAQKAPRQRIDISAYSAIPDELKQRPQWVVWKLEPRDGGGKPTKKPYNAASGRLAKANDPATWASYDRAVQALASGAYNGIGYFFAPDDPYVGIDLDHSFDDDNLAAWAVTIINQLDSYAEISQSGTGAHIIVRASLDALRKQGGPLYSEKASKTGKRRDDVPGTNGGGIEVYDRERFFVFTGNHLDSAPVTIEDRQAEALAIFQDYLTTPAKQSQRESTGGASTAPANASDAVIIARISKSKQAAKFDRLMRGDTSDYPKKDGGNDESRADQALADIITFYTRDAAQIESIFSQSALAQREKWQRADYRAQTISAALTFVTESAKTKQAPRLIFDEDTQGEPTEDDTAPYALTSRGFTMQKRVGTSREDGDDHKKGDPIYLDLPLCNFTAKIEADIIEDDGSGDVRRLFGIVAKISKRTTPMFTIPASQFKGLNWVFEKIGASATLESGQGTPDHVRAAIQKHSRPAEQIVYTHTGWRKIDGGEWVYLHAGGAVISQISQSQDRGNGKLTNNHAPIDSALHQGSSNGNIPISQISQISQQNSSSSIVSVNLSGDAMERFSLPVTASHQDTAAAVLQALRLLDVAPDRVTAPLFAAVFRAALGECDFALHLSGQSGAMKSSLAGCFQAFYGAEMNDHASLPANWTSTAAYLENQAFRAKDALLVIDEYKPMGTMQKRAELDAKVDAVIRASGNSASRGRMRANMESRASRKPRCLILSTGEDTPNTGSESLTARMLAIDIAKGEINKDLLSFAQSAASGGVYALAMSGYLSFIAARHDLVTGQLKAAVSDYAGKAQIDGHARTPRIIGNLAAGFQWFLEYAHFIGAIDLEAKTALWSRVWSALIVSGQAQKREQQANNPVSVFFELLTTAIQQGHAKLTELHIDDYAPGDRVGWYDGHNVYLLPGPAYMAACEVARRSNRQFVTSERKLWGFMSESSIILSRESSRDTYTVRKYIAPKQYSVIHIHDSNLEGIYNFTDYSDYSDYKRASTPDSASDEGSKIVSQFSENDASLVSKNLTNAPNMAASAQKVTPDVHTAPRDGEHFAPSLFSVTIEAPAPQKPSAAPGKSAGREQCCRSDGKVKCTTPATIHIGGWDYCSDHYAGGDAS